MKKSDTYDSGIESEESDDNGSEPKTARDKEIIGLDDHDKEPLQSVQEYKGNLDLTFGDEDK